MSIKLAPRHQPEVIRSLQRWKELRKDPRWNGKSFGFVPTMGALHAGHRSLIERSRAENDVAVLSLFVNPSQFNDPKDFASYPIRTEQDLNLAAACGVDFVLMPTAEELYADGYRFRVIESEFSKLLCGEHRPGHFDGVLTVVLKLLSLVRPDRAYFGEKDYQQLTLIREMVDSFYINTTIVACPTIRDTDGLALSSRNALLSEEARQKAATFPRLLSRSQTATEVSEQLVSEGFSVDYITDLEGRRYGAVRIDGVRLIDNVKLKSISS